MIRYGDMQESEADLLDELLVTIGNDMGEIRFLEIGVLSGNTVRGIVLKCQELGFPVTAAGVDFEQWKPNPLPRCEYKFYAGDSMDAWRVIDFHGRTFNLLFIDGCHCVVHSSQDFLNYSPFVEVGGFVLFHDTAVPSGAQNQDTWPQNHSYAGKPDSVLGVREGLKKLGLLQGHRTDWKLVKEVPSDTGLMGAMLFQKVKEL